jgi:hypothetical protein
VQAGLVLVDARAVEGALEFEDVVFSSPPDDRVYENKQVGVETLLFGRFNDSFVRPRPLRTKPYNFGRPAAPPQEGLNVLDTVGECFNRAC